MQLVVPRAVRMAVAIDAMICNAHLSVSFLVIAYKLKVKHLGIRLLSVRARGKVD